MSTAHVRGPAICGETEHGSARWGVPRHIMQITGAMEPFANYLARYLIAAHGFTRETVPEARALASACDIVLTRARDKSFDLVCIVDREAQPMKRFEMAPDQLIDIGKRCRKYAGKGNLRRPAIKIHIFEIGPDADAHERIMRLHAFRQLLPLHRVLVSVWAIDPTSASFWTRGPPLARVVDSSEIEHLLRMPRDGAELAQMVETQRAVEALSRQAGVAYVTYGLVVTLLAAFACELIFGLDPAPFFRPSLRTLVAMGGLNWIQVQSGEWYRLLSAPFLHLDPFHLAMNTLVLLVAGTQLERIIGSGWFAFVYLAGAICGSLLSLVINPANVVSVGASGAIMGVVAAMWVYGFRFPPGRMRSHLQGTALGVLIPSLLPVATMVTGARVDLAGHVGGALGGALVAWIFVGLSLPEDARRRFQRVAAGIAACGLVVVLAMLPWIADGWLRSSANLIPEHDVPMTEVGQRYQAPTLVARHPRDPRARLFLGEALLAARNLDGAERELRAGLAETEILRRLMDPAVEAKLRATLGVVLLQRGQAAESTAVVEPVCRSSAPDLATVRERLTALQLCR